MLEFEHHFDSVLGLTNDKWINAFMKIQLQTKTFEIVLFKYFLDYFLP